MFPICITAIIIVALICAAKVDCAEITKCKREKAEDE